MKGNIYIYIVLKKNSFEGFTGLVYVR